MGHREDLLAAAKRLLAEKGYAHITARDLVASSGTNLASIGYHFGSKDALLNAAVLDSFDDWDDEIQAAMDQHAGDTPVDRLEGFLTGLVGGLERSRPIAVASVHAYAQFEYVAELRDQLSEKYESARNELAQLLFDDQEVDDETARTVGSLALCMINGMVLQWLIDPDRAPTPADLAAALRRLAAAM
ncbi:TetR/AcrR family transcriptional regulator [Jiangella gansuensis]|uniref:TetR/AcrR family transcriptional regulator n=1 Tax=Jiangella gansuensis TaxID=281473 RepID=UPI00047EBEC1|nr:TetR/AcrR family transcriptional regulator [Jiangella gansuensis]